MFSLEKYLLGSSVHFSISLCGCFVWGFFAVVLSFILPTELYEFFIYFGILAPYQIHDLQVFSPIQKVAFSFWCFPYCANFLVGYRPTYLFLLLLLLLLVADSNKSSPRPTSRHLPPVFSSTSFMVSGLTLKSLIHFELIFIYSVRQWVQFYSFAYGCPMFPTKRISYSETKEKFNLMKISETNNKHHIQISIKVRNKTRRPDQLWL